MTGAEAARAAFGRVCQLAEEHARDLDGPQALMAAQTWVGGGAPAFAADLAAQRQRMQGGWVQALQDIAQEAARQGGSRLAPPEMTTAAAPAHGRGRLTGIDPSQVSMLIRRLSAAGRSLPQAASLLSAELSVLGLPGSPAQAVADAGKWAGTQAGVLARRLAAFEAADRAAGHVKLISPLVTGFGLFGGYAPGLGKAAALLEEAAAGNLGALAAVLKQQQAGAAPGLAEEVSAWWQLLTPAQQKELVSGDPAVAGWLDGLPATVRDTANRKVFGADYARLTAEAAKLEAELKGDTSGLLGVPGLGSLINDMDGTAVRQAVLAQVEGILRGMDAIKAALGQPGSGQDGLPPVYLLGFNASDLGHAIVSIGNPDTANNIVTYVPGLGSGFASTASGDLTRANRLWRQASADDPTARTASIYWLGYDAPQLDLSVQSVASALAPGIAPGPALHLAENTQVAYTADATAAAPALGSFAAGLAAAHDPAFIAHTVMLGHSYGSLVVGEAAVRAPGKLAQDLAFVGSPGVGVNKASQLGVPADHVFAGEAANDPVPGLPPVDPLLWFNSYSAHFGTDPATPQFGGRDFSVDPGKPVSFSDPIGAHSQYWDIGSSSLKNLARIVDGQYGQVQQATLPQPTQPGEPGAGMPGGPYP
jgi:Alpha/beta hydrolase